MKYVIISYILHMLIILITPWESSLYNVFVNTLEFLVTELICIVLYKYHDSIEESKKTILNYQIQVIALSYGGIYFWTFLVNLVIFIILHSGFRTFPHSFLDFNKLL